MTRSTGSSSIPPKSKMGLYHISYIWVCVVIYTVYITRQKHVYCFSLIVPHVVEPFLTLATIYEDTGEKEKLLQVLETLKYCMLVIGII